MRSTALTAQLIAETTAELIPLAGIDLFYWPCIAGEDFPPTFTGGADGGAGYARQTAFPAVVVSSGILGSTSVQWPFLPLYQPRAAAFGGFSVSFRLFIPSANFGATDGVAVEVSVGGALISIQTFSTGFVSMLGAGSNIPFIPSFDNWYDYTLRVTAAGVLTAILPGGISGSLAGTAPTDAPQIVLVARPNPGGKAVALLTTVTYSYLSLT